ncbi:hypothetical protein GCM10011519_30040 [Marmoricola endophyticus]|uniref:Uncharacterized protein n=1 Tax=Marmoricola endophyticus TaxID=2040280 RepID=A0A917BTR1_9ACTN|nr:hypothetical protein [Marmoricola endophyticus]GGF54135.1 hypothetical protein GCM10011519_30040 [Marmoricola endophyticus]
MHSILVALAPLAADPTPKDDDVVAGWGGFAVFIGLCVAVALIGYFLVRSLKTARKNLYVEPEEPVEGHPEMSPEARRDAERSGEM